MIALRYHEQQQGYWHSLARFNILRAGRRAGKTEFFARKVHGSALEGEPGSRWFIAAPTWGQVRTIYWNRMKAMAPANSDISESRLSIIYPTGNEVFLIGMDKPMRIEGAPVHGGGLDEFDNMKMDAWKAHVRPMLSETHGWCDLLGVPEGMGNLYALEQQIPDQLPGTWAVWRWPTSDIQDPAEVEQAKADMDERIFAQEYEGAYVGISDQIYYGFSAHNIGTVNYDPRLPLIVCFDFNVKPGVAVICQEQKLPSGLQGTAVVDEVYIPANSNTQKVCAAITAKYGSHRGPVRLYGDATGGAGGTAKLLGTDWDIIKLAFWRQYGQGRIQLKVPSANPPERSRVNAVNSRLCAADSSIKMIINPRCKMLIRDLEGVASLPDGSIEKKSNPLLTHSSDALGYYIVAEFPVRAGIHSRIQVLSS